MILDECFAHHVPELAKSLGAKWADKMLLSHFGLLQSDLLWRPGKGQEYKHTMTLVPRPIGRGLKANKKFLPYLGWFCFSWKADHGYREQETSFRFKKRYRYTVHVMASWAHPTKNRAKIRNRKRIHRSLAECRQPRTSNLWSQVVLYLVFENQAIVHTRPGQLQGGSSKIGSAFPSFSKTPQGPPYLLIHWQHVWGEVHVQEVVHANSSCEALLGSGLGLGLWFFHVEGSGYHSAWTGDFPSHAGQHDW